MGLGASIASNTASAVANAYTNVVDQTSVSDDQKTVQTQSVTLENCDVTAGQNVNIAITDRLKQSMHQVATVTDNSTIANDIAQALAQSATAHVGAGVIGISDANNQASTYANMTTNVSNMVKFSAKQATEQTQSFTCQNSTIIAEKGNFNLSELSMGNVSQYTDDQVMNTTNVRNKITQTIKQTATASTGMSWWVILAIAVLLIVGGIIFKLKDAKSKASRAIDMQQAIELGCCTKDQLNISNLSGGGIGDNTNMQGMQGMQGPSGNCAGCDCYKLAHPEAHVSKASVIIYFLGILLIGGLIGVWYALAMGRGCLYDDACGTNLGSGLGGAFAGCSCQFEMSGEGDQVCKDSLHASFSGNGLPIKYQYTLFVQDQSKSGNGCKDSTIAPASLQGMLVSALAAQSTTSGSNSGKNMDTLNRYFCYYGLPSSTVDLSYLSESTCMVRHNSQIQNMFKAAVIYIGKNPQYYSPTFDFLNELSDDDKPRALYAFVCPLRSVLFKGSGGAGNLLTGTWPSFSQANTKANAKANAMPTPDPLGVNNVQWVQATDASPLLGVLVPQAFRYGDKADTQGDTWNTNAGCCSLHSVKFVDGQQKDAEGKSLTGMGYTCGCADLAPSGSGDPNTDPNDFADQTQVTNFCNGNAGVTCGANGTCSDGSGTQCQTDSDCQKNLDVQVYPGTNEPALALPDPTQTYGSGCTGKDQYVTLDDQSNLTTLYAEWTDFHAFIDNINDEYQDHTMSLMRLLWTGILSYIQQTSTDTIYGVNAALLAPNPTDNIIDHYYVQNVKKGKDITIYGEIGDTINNVGSLDDPTLLNIELLEARQYSPKAGLGQASCDATAPALRGQGYKASAQKLGYCRSKFFNRITLYTLFGFFALWILSLPIFLVVRWYVNKGVSAKYLAAANAQAKPSQSQRVSVAQSQPQNQAQSPAKPTTSPPSQQPQLQPQPQPQPQNQESPLSGGHGYPKNTQNKRNRKRKLRYF